MKTVSVWDGQTSEEVLTGGVPVVQSDQVPTQTTLALEIGPRKSDRQSPDERREEPTAPAENVLLVRTYLSVQYRSYQFRDYYNDRKK